MALPKPITRQSDRRMQEAGKIKIGVFDPKAAGGKGRPKTIDTFRFTSDTQSYIERIAEIYGGNPVLSKGKWEVTTQANEIDIVLPPDPLHGTPIYELWGGKGMERRCTGEDDDKACTRFVVEGREQDLVEYVQPCICWAQQKLACKPTTRLSVLLPQVALGGVWNFKSGSDAAAEEMKQFVGIIEQAQASGLTVAKLGITKRSSRGGARLFNVPTLRLEVTIQELMEGGAALQARQLEAATTMAALPAPTEMRPDQREQLNQTYKRLPKDTQLQFQEWLFNLGYEMKHLTAIQADEALAQLVELLEPGDGEIVDEAL